MFSIYFVKANNCLRGDIVHKKNGFLHEISKNKEIYILTIPGILFFLLFNYIPMTGIVLAFKDFNVIDGVFGSPWNGFKNFEFFFTSEDAARITFNTLFLNAMFIVSQLVFSIGMALMLNEIKNKIFAKTAKTIVFFPYFLSWVVVSGLLFSLFSTGMGTINDFLEKFDYEKVQWYTEAKYWRSILVGTHIWKWTGHGSIIYLAVITSIDPTFYEAATVDGASKIQKITHITLPNLIPVVSVLTLLAIGRIFYGDFGMVYSIIKDNGLLLRTTEVIDTYVFRAMRITGDFSLSTAIGLYQSLAGFILVLSSNLIARKINEDGALF